MITNSNAIRDHLWWGNGKRWGVGGVQPTGEGVSCAARELTMIRFDGRRLLLFAAGSVWAPRNKCRRLFSALTNGSSNGIGWPSEQGNAEEKR